MTATDVKEFYTGEDEDTASLLSRLLVKISDYNNIQAKLDAATGDPAKAIENWMNTSDDDKAVKLRAQIEKLNEALKSLAEQNVSTDSLSEEELEKLKTEQTTLGQKVKAHIKAVKTSAEALEIDEEGIKEALNKIGDPTKKSAGRPVGSGEGKGKGLPRANVYVKLSKGDTVLREKAETFSEVVKVMEAHDYKWEMDNHVEEIQKAFATAANVEHGNIAQVKDPQEFNMGDFKLNTSFKETLPRGRKAAKQEEKKEEPAKEETPAA